MKKFLKIFFAVVLVVIIAVVGLVTFVDPNEYRGYMVQKVQQKTGYLLEINGDLRWHVWPQVSILVDDVTVTAPGAQDKMVRAENMRLDVEIIPLFSKRLAVKEVLLKGAVIRLTDETNPLIANETPNPQSQQQENRSEEALEGAKAAQEWSLVLKRFEIANSIFVLQQSANKDDLLTVRDINILLTMKGQRQVNLVANSNINRNRQDIVASIKANADLQAYPKQISLVIDELNYHLQGAGFPVDGIKGLASGKIDYDLKDKNFALTNLKVSANNESITGEAAGVLSSNGNLMAKLSANTSGGNIDSEITGTLGDIPDFIIKVTGNDINVDKISSAFAAAPQTKSSEIKESQNTEQTQEPTNNKTANESSHELAFLNGLNAQLLLNVNSLIVKDITINNIEIEADNKQGEVQLKKLSGQLFGGSISAPGSINTKGKLPFVQLMPKIENIDMDNLSKAFNISQTLSGQLNMNGKVSGSGIKSSAIKSVWNADLNTRIDNARLNNLNLRQIIQQAATLSSKDINADERYDQYTQVRKLSMRLLLQKGTVRMSNITVDSDALTVAGSGSIGLAKMQCDVRLNVKVLQGWQGKKDVVDILKATSIPVQIYGPCNNLAYKVDVERIIRDQLKTQANKAIERYLGNSDQKKQDAVDKIFSEIIGKKR